MKVNSEILRLKIKFGSQIFEELFKDEILKQINKMINRIIIIIITKIMMTKKKWELRFWKLNEYGSNKMK